MSSRRNILIVDDEPLQTRIFEKFIGDMDHNIITVDSGKKVLDFFLKKRPIKDSLTIHDIDVMLLDLSMPEIDGLSLLKEIATVKGDLQVIVLTATNNISMAVAAISLGAVDYIVKGEKDVYARVITSINNAIEKRSLKYQLSTIERHTKDQVSFTDIIGKSDHIMLALALAKKIANSAIPVLIEGPNGVGKELLARSIHGSSTRSGKPFVTVDCESLKFGGSDEALFGVDRMLDSGVIEKGLGKIREANGGTMFLDNVNALKLETQIKLLRFIQEGEIEAVGSKVVYKSAVRIISSTNKNLRILVDENRFREDLYYRLNIFPITLPSLKERGSDDIRLLAESFCYNFCISENKKIKGFSNEAMDILSEYEWEDNIRQLKSYIFRAVVLCDDEFINPEHLPRNVRIKDDDKDDSKAKRICRRTMELIDIFDDESMCKTLDQIEEEVVRRLVEFYNGNLSEVAKQLKVGRSTVYRKLKILNQSSQLTDQND